MSGRKEKRAADPNKVGVVKFWAWQSRGVSIACLTIIFGYLMIFCTDTLGLNAATVGMVLMVSKIFDGISDFIACYIVDNTRTRWGKGRPYEFCILGVWICTMLLFYTPAQWGNTVKYIWLFVMYTFIFSIFSTLLGANQTPYMIRAFDNNPVKLAKVGALGGMVIMLGAMAVSISFPVVMAKLATSPAGWRSLITIYSVPLCLIGTLRFLFVKEDPSIDEAAGNSKVSVRDILSCLKQNQYAWFFAGIMGCYNITVGLNAGSYYFTYVVGDMSLFGVIQMMSIVTLPVMFVFPPLMKRLSASKMIVCGAAVGTIGYLVLFFAQKSMPMLVIGTIFMGVGQFPVAYLQQNIGMQLADYNEYIGLPRMDSSVGVMSGAFGKIGNGLGSALLGGLLAAAGYVGSASVQSGSALLMIRLTYSLIPMAAIWLMSYFAMCMFSLDKKQNEIQAVLSEKRGKVNVQ